MNGATSVPSSVFSAMKGRNITAVFMLSNGIRWTVNGRNVGTARTVDIYSASTKGIPSSAVRKVSSGSVGTAQVLAGSPDTSFGFTGKITVKLNKSRAGRRVVVYRYSSATRKLYSNSTTSVSSTGHVTFSASKGGYYLIVIK
jgi:regulator of RNase E activity RraA